MIIRKPYAFLIKYFQRINILLLALVVFVFYKVIQLHQFVKDYLNTGVYNEVIDTISNYANIYVYFAFLFIIFISLVLAYLLKRKDKPFISYIYILITNFLVFILFLYTSNYFTYEVVKGYNLVATKVINDLFFIVTLPYYPMLVILLIRSIGIDLKSFGFHEDKEFAEIKEEDREEVEVQVGFDKDKWIRKIKYRIRHAKYFFLEHKIPLIIVFVLVFGIFSFNFYNYFYVENKIYDMNNTFKSNNYNITVNNAYLTDKDYAGNVVSEEGTYFILIDIKLDNLLSVSRDFDIEKMLLFVDNDFYVPTTRFNSYFTDMGNLYTGKSLPANKTSSYLLVYEIPKPREGANLLLKYQDLTSSDGKLIRVRIKVLNISTFKEKGNSSINNKFTVPINLDEEVTFTLNDFKILDSVTYTYQQCGPNSCPIYQETVTAPSNKKILYLRGNYDDYTTKEFLNFLSKYAKISYLKDGLEYESNIKYAVNRTYQGNHIYLLVDSNVASSDSIKLVFTIRTYRYFYQLKGE